MPESDLKPERIVDAREISPRVRHTIMFQLFEALAPGRGFQIVSDHDPRMLRNQFALRYAERADWTYIERGPDIWRVRIGRTGS